MTIEERAAKAADLKAAGACNCSQAVVKVFEDKLRSVYKELHADRETGCGQQTALCSRLGA